MTTPSSQAEFDLRMPAEWEPHEATWIAWPHQRADWPGKFPAIPWVYAEIVRVLHQSEKVFILVNGPAGEKKARTVLEKQHLDWSRIVFFNVPTDRVWTAQITAPAPVYTEPSRDRVLLNWQFNGWAKVLPNWK